MSIGTQFEIWNWWIGSIAPPSSFPRHPAEQCLADGGTSLTVCPVLRRHFPPSLRHHAGRTHDIQHAGAETEQQEHDQTPGRCPRHAVDDPADAGPTTTPAMNSLESLNAWPKPGVPPASLVLPPAGLGAPCRKRCFKFAPTSLKIVVADAGFMPLPQPVLRFRLALLVVAIATSLPGQTVTAVRFKVAGNIVSSSAPVKPGSRTHDQPNFMMKNQRIKCDIWSRGGAPAKSARAASRDPRRLSSSRRHRCGRRYAGRSWFIFCIVRAQPGCTYWHSSGSKSRPRG